MTIAVCLSPAQGTDPLKIEAARSGINTGHHQCKAPDGDDWNHPLVPWDYDLDYDPGVGWLVVVAVVGLLLFYLLVGTLAVPPFGKVRVDNASTHARQ